MSDFPVRGIRVAHWEETPTIVAIGEADVDVMREDRYYKVIVDNGEILMAIDNDSGPDHLLYIVFLNIPYKEGETE